MTLAASDPVYLPGDPHSRAQPGRALGARGDVRRPPAQRPYRLWVHTHTFAEHERGTLVADSVRYELPLGPLGDLGHALIVRRDLQQIFDFRRDAVVRLLG